MQEAPDVLFNSPLAVSTDHVYFLAEHDGAVALRRLHKQSGVAMTVVEGIGDQWWQLVVGGDRLYFWDTFEGVRSVPFEQSQVQDEGLDVSALAAIGTRLYWVLGDELWRRDSSNGLTELVATLSGEPTDVRLASEGQVLAIATDYDLGSSNEHQIWVFHEAQVDAEVELLSEGPGWVSHLLVDGDEVYWIAGEDEGEHAVYTTNSWLYEQGPAEPLLQAHDLTGLAAYWGFIAVSFYSSVDTGVLVFHSGDPSVVTRLHTPVSVESVVADQEHLWFHWLEEPVSGGRALSRIPLSELFDVDEVGP